MMLEACDSLCSKSLALADPFILLHEGVYYAYGTNHPDGIAVYESSDMIHWRSRGLALRKEDTWATHYFWAPEVYKVGDRFLMYFSAEEHISAAFSESPLGPFRQLKKSPMLPDEKGIDHSLLIASSGNAYIFWNAWRSPGGIYVAELEDDLITLKHETIRHCFAAEQPWETQMGRINEGPFCIEHEGRFILTYSGNDYQSQDYAVGAAVADSPLGPWRKYEENPLLHRPGALVGVGHHSFFRDKDGNLKIVFHAHNSVTTIHPRLTFVSDVIFENGRIRISPDYVPLLHCEL